MTIIAAQPISTNAYVREQTIISIIVSMAFSAGFFLLVFRNAGSVEVWDPDFLAYDFLPQSGVASLMAALMPALQTRAAMVRGELSGNAPSAISVAVRSLMFALLGLGLGGIVIAILLVSGITVFPWSTAFAIKVAYGGLLGLIITPPAVRVVLSKG